nr:MAG TPA: hypothetical protein [Caudoviricetes sp.]
MILRRYDSLSGRIILPTYFSLKKCIFHTFSLDKV